MRETGNKTRSLARGSAIYSIGNIGTLVINFFLVPFYTFFLSNEELGYFDLVASASILLAPIFFGHIELAVLRWVLANNNPKNISRVVSSCLMVFLIGLFIFSVVFSVVHLYTSITLAPYVFLYFVSIFFYVIAKQVVRSVYSSLHYVLTELFYILIVLILSILFVSEYGLIAIFTAYGFASASFLIYLLAIKITKHIDLKAVRVNVTKELLNYSFPLVLNAMSLWMNNQSSKYIIASFLTLSANGIYAIAFKIAYVIQILNRIFYYSFQDKMFAIYGKDGFKDYFEKTFNTYSGLLFSILYLLISTQKILLPFIIDTDFLEATRYIPILALGVVFMSLASILGIIYQCEKKNMHAFKTSLVSGLLIVATGFLFIPKYQLYGASSVFAFGNFVWLLYRYFDVQKFVALRVFFWRFILYIVIAFGIYSITQNEQLWASVLAICLAVIISLYFSRDLVRKFLTVLLKK
ncbi:lipopolysaccharide biosynthesis protein [Eudoraea sp.]|uniref:lipopolysaccharide biosynthesis protein n=1 Tax=Eudoraea sp. TaxID=1979955 RepID=UPI003C7577EE